MSRVRVAVVALVLSAACLAACGDVYADPLPDEVEVDGGVDGGVVLPRDLPSACPWVEPEEGTRCNVLGSSCEYGASPDMSCNVSLSCWTENADPVWVRRSHETCSWAGCPSGDVASLDGQPCSVDTLDSGVLTSRDADEHVCPMADGVCACTTGPDGAHAHARRWACVRPISACPLRRPLAGQPCSGSAWCDYGSCRFKRGLLIQCENDVWITGGATCP